MKGLLFAVLSFLIVSLVTSSVSKIGLIDNDNDLMRFHFGKSNTLAKDDSLIIQSGDGLCLSSKDNEIRGLGLMCSGFSQVWTVVNASYIYYTAVDACLCYSNDEVYFSQDCNQNCKWYFYDDLRIVSETNKCLTSSKKNLPLYLDNCSPSSPSKLWTFSKIPIDWLDEVTQGSVLFSGVEPKLDLSASIGNGYISTTIGSDSVYVSGVFNGRSSLDPSHRARIPSYISIDIENESRIASGLDLKQAVYKRISYLDGSFGYLEIQQSWFASREAPFSVIQHEIKIIKNLLNANITLNLSVNNGLPSKDISFKRINTSQNIDIYCGNTTISEEESGELTSVCSCSTTIPKTITIQPSTQDSYYFIMAVRTSLDTRDPQNSCINDFKKGEEMSMNGQLMSNHLNSWKDLWASSITISEFRDFSDVEIAQSINSSVYYILSSIRSDWDFSLSPGGLATNGYNGHTFWDCETWVYPFLLTNYPSLAKSVLRYRLNRLEGAKKKAASYHPPYRGVMFPWESAFSGIETCPTFADTGLYEIHISGDIVFAVQQYYYHTKDLQFLDEYKDLVFGVAEFFDSRSTNVSTNGDYQYHIKGVIPPDEYAFGDNSVFTNVVAKISLEFAVEISNTLSIHHKSSSKWSDIATRIKIPFDETKRIHLEYDGYKGATIKQADVVLLGYPLNYEMSNEVRLNDLKYYETRTDVNGPAMTWGMHSIAYLELKDMVSARPLFWRSFDNIQAPYFVWTETPQGGAVNFITGSGGFLQTILAGYAGWRIHRDYLMFDPLMFTSEYYKLGLINYLGSAFSIEIGQDYFYILIQSSGSVSLCISDSNGNESKLDPMVGNSLPRQKVKIFDCNLKQNRDE